MIWKVDCPHLGMGNSSPSDNGASRAEAAAGATLTLSYPATAPYLEPRRAANRTVGSLRTRSKTFIRSRASGCEMHANVHVVTVTGVSGIRQATWKKG